MNISPKDLTRISVRNGGTFPTTRVLSNIDGYARSDMDGPGMPEFGELMSGDLVPYDSGDGIETPTPRKLVALANISSRSSRRREMRLPALFGLGLALSACTTFPEIDAVETPGIDTAPYPDLVPIETLLECRTAPRHAGAPRRGREPCRGPEKERGRASGADRRRRDARSRMQAEIERPEDG